MVLLLLLMLLQLSPSFLLFSILYILYSLFFLILLQRQGRKVCYSGKLRKFHCVFQFYGGGCLGSGLHGRRWGLHRGWWWCYMDGWVGVVGWCVLRAALYDVAGVLCCPLCVRPAFILGRDVRKSSRLSWLSLF